MVDKRNSKNQQRSGRQPRQISIPKRAPHWPRPFAMQWGLAMNGIIQSHFALHKRANQGAAQRPNISEEDFADLLPFGRFASVNTKDMNTKNMQNLADHAIQTLQIFHQQITRYRTAKYSHIGMQRKVLLRKGNIRLLQMRNTANIRSENSPQILVIPSLVNRYYIMDLSPKYSFFRYLTAQGFIVNVVDWGAPTSEESQYDLTDYIDFLQKSVAKIQDAQKEVLHLIGYCMGGVLAVGLLHQLRHTNPSRYHAIGKVTLVATPWDFHAVRADYAKMMGQWADHYFVGDAPLLTPDLQHCLFLSLDPWLVLKKYLRFAKLPEGSAAAKHFVLIEDWVNDGVALNAHVARSCLGGWYGRNILAKGGWIIAGQPVNPTLEHKPILMVNASHDRLIPMAMSEDLYQKLDQAQWLKVATGHVGLMAGSRAPSQCWNAIIQFLNSA